LDDYYYYYYHHYYHYYYYHHSKVDWLDQARVNWSDPEHIIPGKRLKAVMPIWRNPWMFAGPDTYISDVLQRMGVDNAITTTRYPRVPLDSLPPIDLVVLSTEPYHFTQDDGPDAFPTTPCAVVDGRLLTW